MVDLSTSVPVVTDDVQAYCFRCKERKPMQGATETRMRNGKRAFTGACVTCGTRMFKIASPDDLPAIDSGLAT